MLDTTIDALTNQTTFTLIAGSTRNDAYNGRIVHFKDAGGSEEEGVGVVLDYVGATKGIVLEVDPVADWTMASGDTVLITTLPGRQMIASTTSSTLQTDMQADPTDFHVNLYEIAGTAAETTLEAEAVDALESFELDNLLSVSTGVAADGDLEAFVSAGTVMAHLMGIAADVTEYDATVDSLEALGAHADTIETDTAKLAYLVEDTGQTTDQDLESYVAAGSILAHLMGEAGDVTLYKASTDAMSLGNATAAGIADAVWDELTADHKTAATYGALMMLINLLP